MVFVHRSIYENYESVLGSQSNINASLILNYCILHCILIDLFFLFVFIYPV